jgi:plastocyanin
MVNKIDVVIASVVIGGAIVVTTYVLSDSMDMGVEGSESSIRQPTATPIPSNSIIVKIVANTGSNSFRPNPVEVNVGESVTWINDDSGIHTLTSKDGMFDSGMMEKGQSFSFAFDKAGEYPCFCEPHPNMVGTVVVTES